MQSIPTMVFPAPQGEGHDARASAVRASRVECLRCRPLVGAGIECAGAGERLFPEMKRGTIPPPRSRPCRPPDSRCG